MNKYTATSSTGTALVRKTNREYKYAVMVEFTDGNRKGMWGWSCTNSLTSALKTQAADIASGRFAKVELVELKVVA